LHTDECGLDVIVVVVVRKKKDCGKEKQLIVAKVLQ
jgi:hypothetical protein